MNRTDEVLVLAHRQGDKAAFDELVDRHAGSLFGYLVRMTGRRDQAEDLFQETFLRVHSRADTFREGAAFKPWLFTIATRVAIDHRRGALRRLPTRSAETAPPAVSEAPGPPADAARSELKAQVRRAVDALPDRQRAALVLSRFEGLSYPEVARIMDCSVGTVKTHVSRALQALARRLPDPGGDEA